MDDMNLSIPFPEMGIEIDLSEMIPQNLMVDLNTDLYILGANLQQPIFTGGKILTGNKMAQKGIEITEEFSAMTRMNVIAEAENAYWNYFLIGDKIELLKQYELLLDTLYQSVSDMILVQMATDSELLKITSRKSNIQYQMHKAINGKELLRMQLCRIIGVDLNTEIVLTDTISENEIVFGTYDLTSRPEYRMLQKQVELKELNIKNVRSDYLPHIGAMAGLSYLGEMEMGGTSVKMDKPIPMIMASLNIPVFSFGEGTKKIKSAKIARDIQQEELNKNAKLLTIEVQYAERNLMDAYFLISTAKIGLEQAEDNLNRWQNNYELGMATLFDVLDAQTQWQEAYSNAIEAKVNFKIKETEYLKVTGGLE